MSKKVEKAFHKIQHPLMIKKNYQEIRYRRILPQDNTVHI
jgi:hypothetical protein